MKRSVNVLFVFRFPSSFVKEDYEIIKRNFHLLPLHVVDNLFSVMISFLIYVWFSDVIFIWFAGFPAFFSILFAKVLGKKVIVVAGGNDAACVPEIGYGAFTSWWRGKIVKFVFNNANIVLAVSNNTKREVLLRSTPKKIAVVYNGINIKKFTPLGKKENIILTVRGVNARNLKRKGIEFFIKVAEQMPQVNFILVGKSVDDETIYLKSIASKNVDFTGYVPFEKLLEYYRKSKVYAQFSRHEGFGVALAEAMACECVPVVTNLAALPEVVGDCGFYASSNDPISVAGVIKRALEANQVLGRRARERVVRLFSVEDREKRLVYYISELVEGGTRPRRTTAHGTPIV